MQRNRIGLAVSLLAAALIASGCRQDMHDQAKLEPLEPSAFFTDGTSARGLVEGTVARGNLREDRLFYTGLTEDDAFTDTLPMEVSRQLLERGKNRFEAFCAACHGRAGHGQGMVVQRGFKHPNSFHEERLRRSPVGYFYNVITNGFGDMASYASQVGPEDRWAIAAYIRALQLSQNASIGDLAPEDLERLEGGGLDPAAEDEGAHGE